MHDPIRSVGPALAAALLALPLPAPGQVVHYSYDPAGRLSVVGDARGDLAVYQYDAVGNLLAIRRIAVADVADAVVIAHVSPEVASRGAVISILGKGFGATPEANAIGFDGVPATVLTASPTRLTVRVPSGARTGPIHLTTPLGAATSKPFVVLDALTIVPSAALVAPRNSIRFSIVGDGAAGVRWGVDRTPGGDAQRGTISRDGVYVAPDALPLNGVRITATSLADPAVEATSDVMMLASSRPLFVAAGPLSVGVPTPSPRATITAAVSVASAARTAFATAPPVAVRLAPVILRLTPSEAAPGESVHLIITGMGFDGATRVEFATATGPDTTLIVDDVAVSADGTEATADVVVSPAAERGPRLVRVITAAGSSGDVAGHNILTIR
jgi:hypothetical protein